MHSKQCPKVTAMGSKSITIRMSIKDVQTMVEYLVDHPEIEGTSELVRAAVMKYIKRDGDAASQDNLGGTFVRLNAVELDAIHLAMATGPYISEEEFVRDHLRKAIAPDIEKRVASLLDASQTLTP